MKYAFCNEAYVGWPFDRVCGDLASCGYSGVEIAPFTLDEDPRRIDERRAKEIGEIARREGTEVIGLHWLLAKPDGFHLTTPDAALRKSTVEFLQHLARLCAAMGGRIMVFGSPKQRGILPGENPDDVFARAAEGFRAVCEVAGPLGVTLALEPLSPVETDFLNTASETVRLIRAVDHPACRLHLDVKAMSSEPEPIEKIIRDHCRDLAHFHANDPNRRGPGSGEVDFASIVKALKTINYDGYVSVEVFDYVPDGPTIARTSIEFLKTMFGKI
jgi:sugar phosphate isomerase/epimerase